LSKVSDLVDRQISLADMEKRLIDLYRRLEGRFNVFEANRHLLFEGELMKQSRRDIQPRYLILFSDTLLICKYSRAPSLGTEANFHSDFYKFSVSRIRVKAEEHGEYETHFQLFTTQKSAVFIAKYFFFSFRVFIVVLFGEVIEKFTAVFFFFFFMVEPSSKPICMGFFASVQCK
uniref:PH domain-containing protein n=1 Tax=Gongylonema pulchrum TaxID=637853 RepID=A0A183D6I7_9BILA